MNNTIKQALLSGQLILFVGAGASLDSKSSNRSFLPDSDKLAQLIAEEANYEYRGESLQSVYSAASRKIGQKIEGLFKKIFENTIPSESYISISKYPWTRIYTTNIDDALEIALRQSSRQSVFPKSRFDNIEDKDQVFKDLHLVYLNGSVKRFNDGFIFSNREYASAIVDDLLWHKQLAADFFQCHFLFIGSNLNEPTLHAQIQNYQNKIKYGAPRSFVITPSATEIEKEELSSANLEHISATLAEFCSWLDSEIPVPPYPLDLACRNIPTLSVLLEKSTKQSRDEYADLMQSVTPVSRSVLERVTKQEHSGTIRAFYRGFKPSWRDVLDAVPARLSQFEENLEVLRDTQSLKGGGAVIYGPAGSGKSTFLRFSALDLADSGQTVYEVDADAENLYEIIVELEKSSNSPYYVFLDRFDAVRDPLRKLWSQGRVSNAIIVAAESQRVWFNRVKANIGQYIQAELTLHEISESDVDPLLEKVKKFGPWVRLQKLNDRQRKEELYKSSRSQLLIGLLETTTGIGFDQIIERDYRSIDEESYKTFLILICFCTIHRASASRDLINRALVKLSIKESSDVIASRLGGIVAQQGKFYSARHPVYARRVIDSLIDLDKIYAVCSAILDCFSEYPHPVVQHVEKGQANLFKALINHRFLFDIFRENRNYVFNFYSKYEKVFERDGLFWLQYGLATRADGDQEYAYERLRTALDAYHHDHTVHALAQQELILARSDNVDSSRASDYLRSALDRLRTLDDTLYNSDDTYPLVTMAEGHVKALISISGVAVARIKAKEYADILEKRQRRSPDPRLQRAYENLFKFASTGHWSDEESDY